MNLIPTRSKVSRSTFKKLPIGAVYYLTATSGPFVKQGSRQRLTANVIPQTTPTLTAVTNTSVAVIKVDRFFHREQS